MDMEIHAKFLRFLYKCWYYTHLVRIVWFWLVRFGILFELFLIHFFSSFLCVHRLLQHFNEQINANERPTPHNWDFTHWHNGFCFCFLPIFTTYSRIVVLSNSFCAARIFMPMFSLFILIDYWPRACDAYTLQMVLMSLCAILYTQLYRTYFDCVFDLSKLLRLEHSDWKILNRVWFYVCFVHSFAWSRFLLIFLLLLRISFWKQHSGEYFVQESSLISFIVFFPLFISDQVFRYILGSSSNTAKNTQLFVWISNNKCVYIKIPSN